MCGVFIYIYIYTHSRRERRGQVSLTSAVTPGARDLRRRRRAGNGREARFVFRRVGRAFTDFFFFF